MRLPSFRPRSLVLFILALLIAGMTVEVTNYFWMRDQFIDGLDRFLGSEQTRLRAIVLLSEAKDFNRSEMEKELSRFYSLASMKEYVEILRDGRTLFRSPNLEPTISLRASDKEIPLNGSVTTTIHLVPARLSSSNEGPYRFILAVPLEEYGNFVGGLRSSLDVAALLIMFVFAAAGLINIYILHKPALAMKGYLKELTEQPERLPLPPLSPGIHSDINDLVEQVHTIVTKLHNSRNQALEFSSMASHELRTPLTVLRNQLETALSSQLSGEQLRKIVGSIYDEMLRLNGTVEDLLCLSTLQAGTFKLNFDTFTLEHFLKQFYDEALFLTRPNDVTVVLRRGPQVKIQADYSRLRQVFFNLLDNSIKNTAQGGRIRIGYEVAGNDVLITFADTGRGIPAESLTKIFQPFYKANGNLADPRGTGLGLALVKWIVENHNGKVSVESQPAKGTTFFIRLPLFQPSDSN